MLHFTIPVQHWLLLFPAEFCLSVTNSSPTFQQTLNTIFNNVNHIRPPISYNGFFTFILPEDLYFLCCLVASMKCPLLHPWHSLCLSSKLNYQACKSLVFLFLYLFSNFAGACIPVILSDCKNDNNSNGIEVAAFSWHALWVIPDALVVLHARYIR